MLTRRTSVIFTLATLATASACYKGAAELPPPKVPLNPRAEDVPDAAAIITDEVATLTYRTMVLDGVERFVGVLDHRLQIKILREEGLEVANFKLPLDGFTTISEVVARSVDPFGAVKYMKPGVPRAVPRKGDGENAPELKWMLFEVPNPTVGGVIDVLYTRVYTGAYLVPPWEFGGPLPKVRSEYSVVYPASMKIDHRTGVGAKLTNDPPLRRDLEGGWTRLVFTLTDIPAYYAEPNGPHITWQSPWVATVIVEGEQGGKKVRLQSWSDVAERVMSTFKAVGGAALSGTARDRYAAVRDALNPVEHHDLGTCTPAKAGSLMSGKPACTRDAAALLLNALEGSNAKYYPALITSPQGPVLSEDFPSLYAFTRAVVAVDVREEVKNDPTCREDPISRGLLCSVPEDSFAFLDPLCSGCRYGELPTELTGTRALILFPDEPPRWVDVPDDPVERNRLTTQFRLRLSVNGELNGEMNGELTGATSRKVRRTLRGKANDEDERQKVLSTQVFGQSCQTQLLSPSIEPLNNPDEPLALGGKIRGKVEVLAYEKFRLNPAQVFGEALPGRWRKARRTPAILEGPAWHETVASVEIPVGYDILQDPPVTIVTPYAEYAAGFVLKGRTLNYSRRVVLKRHIITPEEWSEFRGFLERVQDVELNGVPIFLAEDEGDE